MKDRNTALFAEGGDESAGGQWKPRLGFSSLEESKCLR